MAAGARHEVPVLQLTRRKSPAKQFQPDLLAKEKAA
jgi:hypothetical protein